MDTSENLCMVCFESARFMSHHVLQAQTVTVALTSSDPDTADVSPSSLTFTAADYNVSKPVTVSPGNNDVLDGSRTVQITAGATSPDSAFDGLSASVPVTVEDDDKASCGDVEGSSSIVCW